MEEELEERERQHIDILTSEFLEKKEFEAKCDDTDTLLAKIIDEVFTKNLREYLETEPVKNKINKAFEKLLENKIQDLFLIHTRF